MRSVLLSNCWEPQRAAASPGHMLRRPRVRRHHARHRPLDRRRHERDPHRLHTPVLRGAFVLAAIGLGLVDVSVAAVMLATIGVGVVATFVGLIVTIVIPVIIALVVPVGRLELGPTRFC